LKIQMRTSFTLAALAATYLTSTVEAGNIFRMLQDE
jgi:hypothetical protein